MELDTTMTTEVLSVARVMVQASKLKMEEALCKCQYCNKTFRRESTLSVHQCEPKRRWQQEKDTGVQLGLRSYLKFFEMTQGSAKTKSYKDFVESPYYSAFVKFGQHLVAIRAINSSAFIEWIIKANKKLDAWTKEIYYDEYLFEYLRHEHPNDALERSVTEIQRWADENNTVFTQFFLTAAPNKVCQMIVNGRLSPWVLFNCDSGVNMLSTFNTEQVALVYKYIDPEFWQRKFKDFIADTEFIKMVLKEMKI